MKKIITFIIIFAVACIAFVMFTDASSYRNVEISDVSHIESDEFEAVLRSVGNYKSITVFAEYTSHTDGTMVIDLQTDSLIAVEDSWQIIIPEFIIPDGYFVDFSRSFTVNREMAFVDDSVIFYGTCSENTNIIASIIVSGATNSGGSIVVCGNTHKIYTEYDDEQLDYVNHQKAEIDRIIEMGLESTIKSNYDVNYDIDCDGTVTLQDAVKLLRFISEK